jgi:hypothetical protein
MSSSLDAHAVNRPNSQALLQFEEFQTFATFCANQAMAVDFIENERKRNPKFQAWKMVWLPTATSGVVVRTDKTTGL